MNSEISKEFRYIFSGAILLLIASSWMFFDPHAISYFLNENSSSGESVGKLVKQEKDVRKKSSGHIEWQPSGAAQEFEMGDSVYVGEVSNATIELRNGGGLEISSNTLLTFTAAKKKIGTESGRRKTCRKT